ncbi:tyrosine-type recombinase/integrase [Ectopseudomonas hydrolytica]|uniref:tyrosine-type recombinase/integrase n=1 Tax=Ectopseudomonas hydrolytica TaxID=2493633 RepID=UPI003EE00B95
MAGNTQDKRVNDQRLRGLKDGGTLTESLPGRGTGSILFKKVGAVTTAYYRWNLNKKPGQLSIGQYAATPTSPGLRLSDIRSEATRLAQILLEHGNPKDHLARQKSDQEAAEKAAQAESNIGTFRDLLNNYTEDLKQRKRVKAPTVARMFEMHVCEPFPDLAPKPAREITAFDIANILRRVLASKPRPRGKNNSTKAPVTSMRSTTDTLHTYLCAAFEVAKTSAASLERKIEDPKHFGIIHNVAATVGALENVYEGDTESLQQHELGELLRHLDTLPERQRAIALAPIYLGGQRLKMLASVEWKHAYKDGILMIDRKGKGKPRKHYLPLTTRIKEILDPLFQIRLSEFGPFALTENPVSADYLSKYYSDAGKALSEAGLTRYFSWKNVRVSAETMLAGLGVTEEIRSHLLSHGRTGVQAKHYDRNAYLNEKMAALEMWGTYLDDLRAGKIREDLIILSLADIRTTQKSPDVEDDED